MLDRNHLAEDRYVVVDGLMLHYQMAGASGEVILLIHCLSGSAEYWCHNIQILSKKHRVIALDLPGFGLSDKPHKKYTLDFLLSYLVKFIDAVGLKQVTLVGNSLGGGLAIMAAARYPERFKRLILCNAVGLGKRLPLVFKLLKLLDAPFLKKLLSHPSHAQCRFGLQAITTQHQFITDEFIGKQCQQQRSSGAVESLLSALHHIASFFGVKKQVINAVSKELLSLKQPTLIIWGKQDKLLRFSDAKNALSLIPNHTIHLLEACGHLPQLEKPQEVNALILKAMHATEAATA